MTTDPTLLPARDAVLRLSGASADRVTVTRPDPRDGAGTDGPAEVFEVEASDGHLTIRADGPVAAVSAYGAYARRTGAAAVTRFGTRPVQDGVFAPMARLRRQAGLPWRVAYNITVAGYTTPFFDWEQWEHELDLLAASGVNAAHVTLGQEAVWLATFTEYGYRADEVLAWIVPPSHQAWQWLNNIEYFGAGVSRELVERRADLARRVLGRMRELGITPILPGFSGTVPKGFAERNPGAPIVPQGRWFLDLAGPQRPDWLATDSPAYRDVAATFYAQQDELFGISGMWAVDLLHEGGRTGGVPLPDAARGVEAAMRRSDPDYTWVTQAWLGNPRREFLDAVDHDHLLVLDLTGETWTDLDAFDGAPWAYGILPNYGGRTGLYGDLADIADAPRRLRKPELGRLRGLTNMAEGVANNPVVWDLFSDLAWRDDPVDLPRWLDDWVAARYASDDPDLRAAWAILAATAYGSWRPAADAPVTVPMESRLAMAGQPVDAATLRDADAPDPFALGTDGPDGAAAMSDIYSGTDSVIAAVPSVHANQAGMVGPRRLLYPPDALVPALRHLIAGAPAARTPGYEFDLVDVARQVLDDQARRVLPRLADAVDRGDVAALDRLAALFLEVVDAQEAVLATNEHFLLGRWVADARRWGTTPEESAAVAVAATRLLTSWGHEDSTLLTEYATRSWAGLVGSYYRSRWELWFTQVRAAMLDTPTTPVDWYAVARDWVDSDPALPVTAQGDPVDAARSALQLAARLDRELPPGPADGSGSTRTPTER